MIDDNRPDDGDRCLACEAAEGACPRCYGLYCEEHFRVHDCGEPWVRGRQWDAADEAVLPW